MPRPPAPFAAEDFGESVEHIVLGEDDAVMTETGVHRLLDTTEETILVAEGCEAGIVQLCANLVGDEQIERLSVPQLTDRLALGGCAVLVTDAGSLGQKPGRLLSRWRQSDPTAVIVVCGAKDQREALLAELSAGLIHRFLIVPTSSGQTRLVLASALKRHGELRRAEATGVLPALPELVEEPTSQAKPMAIGIGVGIAAIVVLVGWLLLGNDSAVDEPSPPIAGTPVTTPNEVAPEPLDDPAPSTAAQPDDVAVPGWEGDLQRAQQALENSLLLGNDGAVVLFKSVLEIESANADAIQGLAAAEQQLLDRVALALVEGRVDDAETAVADLAYAFPNQPRLPSLEAEVRNERAAGEAVVALPPQPQPSSQPATDFVAMRAVVEARIVAGQLVEPSGDSAQFHLEALRRAGDEANEIAVLETRLQGAAVTRVSEALASADWNAAEQRLVVAGILGVAEAQRADLSAALANGQAQQRRRQQQTILDRAVSAIEGNRLLAPEGDNAVTLLSSLQAQNADLPTLGSTLQAAAEGLGAQAQQALGQGDRVAAAEALAAAENLYPQLSGLDRLKSELSYASRQAELFAELVSASELVLLSYDPPRYPAAAQRRSVEGWVEIVFTVTPEGLPTILIVRSAEPTEVFNENALEAVGTAKFEPYMEDGLAYARRAWIRIRFNLN